MTRGDHVIDVQVVGCHGELAVSILPRVTRPIGVHLDTQLVRVRQIEGLAHEMVGHADTNVLRGQVRSKAAEGRPIGQ